MLCRIATLAAVAAWLPLVVQAADAAAWRTRNIYFALTDRFARSADDSGGPACSDLGRYCGGTFQGLRGKLDYIRGMGFDAIWITPVVENKENGYHGYWAKNLYNINPRFGTADDLKSLINAAHDKGMLVMVDVVANHMGQGSISENSPPPLNQDSSYHPACNIDYSNQQNIERCRLSGLPDINTEDATVRSTFQAWIKWLVTEFRIDGLRIDTVKHVEKDFWPPFVSAAGVFAMGEVFSGDVSYLAGYGSTMPGLLNYADYYPLSRYLLDGTSPQDLVDVIDQTTKQLSDPTTLGTFLDNHDVARWASRSSDGALLRNALAFVILSRGIPVVYYGTEHSFNGSSDPANREDMWHTGYATNGPLYSAISRLSAIKTAAGGLGGNDHVHLYVTSNAYAFSRQGGNVIVLMTNRGASWSGQECFFSRVPNRVWEDRFGTGGASYGSDSSGYVCVQVKNGEPVVLVAK